MIPTKPDPRDVRRIHLWIFAPTAALIVLAVAIGLGIAEWKREITRQAQAAAEAAERAEREAGPAIRQTSLSVAGVDRTNGTITVVLSGVKARGCTTVPGSFVAWLQIDGQWRVQDIESMRVIERGPLAGTDGGPSSIHVPRSDAPVSFGTWRVGDIAVPPQDLNRVTAVRVTVRHECPREQDEGQTEPTSVWGPVEVDVVALERAARGSDWP